MWNPKSLFVAPEINPVTRKARSIPLLNPINVYGRVFFFSWFGFFIAFWAWYAFPPLSATIMKDIGASPTDIANSNIVALLATLLVRLVAGPLCDRFGPRYTFAGILIVGAIPAVCYGGIHNASGLIALRFFVGILGGSFVPCQVWSTGFFDKNVVGSANAIAAGLGNSGGGVTYFVMPAVYDSLLNRGYSIHASYGITFIVPFILIVVTAVLLVLLCPDTPNGKWADRHTAAMRNLAAHGITETVVELPTGGLNEKPKGSDTQSDPETKIDFEATGKRGAIADHEAQISEQSMLETARGEVVQNPSFKEALPVIFSLQTLTLAACYFCSFGTELSVNSILGNYYQARFPTLGQTEAGKWAAMFGLLNVAFRPIGGFVSDGIFRATKNLWLKKMWIHVLGVITGVFLIIIGTLNPSNQSTLFGLIAGMAFFLEAGNGANFSLVPHVHPFANGIVSGVTGASGNFGGIIFAIIFRYTLINGKTNFPKAIWIIGIMTIVINLCVSWIRPIPKGQIGGH